MTPKDVTQTVVIVTVLCAVFAPWCASSYRPIDTTPTVHVVCAVPCSGVILWEGDAARADYVDGQWTVCPTSEPCVKGETLVRTSAACVVTPLVEAAP